MDGYQQVFKLYFHDGETCMKDVFERVSRFLGEDKDEQQLFYDLMYSRTFMFNSPTLMNAGTKTPMLSACFVLPVGDDLYDIFTTARDMAMVFKYGGGVGVSISTLRPKGEAVKGTGGTSSGSVAFAGVFNTVADVVKQGGKRRGALMVSQMCNHPDIFEFLVCKQEEGVNSNFNMSVACTDEFLRCVSEDGYITLEYGGKEYGEVPAMSVYESIVNGMYRNGEPGVLFIDTINKGLPKVNGQYQIITTNPCLAGDTLLWDGDKEVKIKEGGNTFDSWKTGEKHVIEVVLENGASLTCTPDHKIMLANGEFIDASKTLGKEVLYTKDHVSFQKERVCDIIDTKDVVEVYDFTMKDGVHYNTANGIVVHNCGEQPLRSYESCNLGSINVSKFAYESGFDWKAFTDTVRQCVVALNRVLDKNWYPHPKIRDTTMRSRKIGLGIMGFADTLAIMGIRYGSEECIKFTDELFSKMKREARKEGDRFENETVLTVAPTGTISFIADCSPGIEPFFAPVYVHKGFNATVVRVNKHLEAAIKRRYDSDRARSILNEIRGRMSIQDLPIDREIKEVFVCAPDISPTQQIDVMAAAQKYVCNAISKTINVWNGYPKDEMRGLILYAWEKGLKGFTFYRDGSRSEQVVNMPTLDTSAKRSSCPECTI